MTIATHWMDTMRWSRWPEHWFRAGGVDGRPVLNAEQFRSMVRRECALSDRHHLKHSVVIYEFAELQGREPTRQQAARIDRQVNSLQQQRRDGDEIGWISQSRMGLLMPFTDTANASDGWRRVCKRAKLESSIRLVEILTYPSGDFECDQSLRTGAFGLRTATGVAESSANTVACSHFPAWKRAMDVVIAASALVLLAPALLLIALLVRLTSRGPVLFRQYRVGFRGQPFVMWKFRTMVDGADAMKESLRHRSEMTGPMFKIKDDPRITPFGRFLRRTSLDEVPQFWNVLLGDMSLVGPRPATPDEVAMYDRWQHRRLSARPGLTCYWQVEGRGRIGFPESVRMDMRYVAGGVRPSLRADLGILLRTIVVVLQGRGAY